MANWAEIRSRFPALAGRTYLNTATIGQMPESATGAVIAHLERRRERAGTDLPEWLSEMDGVRAKVAQLVSATPEDIGFVPSTSHALAILLNGIAWKPGDRVLTFENEFPNNTYAPALLKGQGVEFLEAPFAEVDRHLNERVRLVIVTAMNYVTGFRAPLAELRAKLDRFGSLLYVDATQGCGALHLDMERLQPDVLGVHGYKWMLSPTGAGFVYVRPQARAWLQPNVVGWRSHHRWQDFDNLHHGEPEFSTAAERYEGCMLAVPLLCAMEKSVELMLEIGPAQIEARVLELAELAGHKVEALGGTVAHGGTAILACRFEGREASALSRALGARGVVTSARHGYLRVSLHFYNNEEDVEVFAAELKGLLESRTAAG